MIGWLRTAAFSLVFYGLSVPIVLFAPVPAMIGQPTLIRYVRIWVLTQRWAAATFLGIRWRSEGAKPDRPVLYVAKHQSMFDAVQAPVLLDAPVIVLKRELARIPVWGWVVQRYGAIVVDRDASAKALRQMVREGKAARAAGRSILIFPEGTRVKPGEQPPLRSGFAGLYRALGLAAVPVANDSGRLWPKTGAKRPGMVTFLFGEAIPPGLSRDDVEALAHRGINALDG
jgi:1-acyl-sn-glycerol-3-phosphate acyltransferase